MSNCDKTLINYYLINNSSFFSIIKKKYLKMSGFRYPVGTRHKCLFITQNKI